MSFYRIYAVQGGGQPGNGFPGYGRKGTLDFELAEIYGYTTKAFNQQVKRNEERFPEDFRFQLTAEEADTQGLASQRDVLRLSMQTKEGR